MESVPVNTKPKIQITNRSQHNDIAVSRLVHFAFGTVHSVWPVNLNAVRLKVTNARRGWGGYAYLHGSHRDSEGFHACVRVGTPDYFRTPRRISYDCKWKDMPVAYLNDWRECLVYVAAHEFAHIAGRSGRKNGEMGCDFAGHDALEEYRRIRAELDETIDLQISQKALKKLAACQREKERKLDAKSTSAKLAKSRRLLAQWERKARLAATKIKKYRRSVAALARSEAKKTAQPRSSTSVTNEDTSSVSAIETPLRIGLKEDLSSSLSK